MLLGITANTHELQRIDDLPNVVVGKLYYLLDVEWFNVELLLLADVFHAVQDFVLDRSFKSEIVAVVDEAANFPRSVIVSDANNWHLCDSNDFD